MGERRKRKYKLGGTNVCVGEEVSDYFINCKTENEFFG